MTTWIRRTLIGVLSSLVLLALALGALVWNGERKRERIVPLPPLKSPSFSDDAAARERGAYLYGSRGCAECHGADGAGRVFVDNGKGLKFKAARLNSQGADRAMARYPNADAFVAMFRSGKRADGRAVQVMPFASFSRMSDTDLRALYLYLKTL